MAIDLYDKDTDDEIQNLRDQEASPHTDEDGESAQDGAENDEQDSVDSIAPQEEETEEKGFYNPKGDDDDSSDTEGDSNTEGGEGSGSLYKPTEAKISGGKQFAKKNKKKLIAGGAGGFLAFILIFGVLFFLSTLKTVHFGEILATAGYARFNGIMQERMTQNIFDASITEGDGTLETKGRSLIDRFKFRNVDAELAKIGRDGRFSVQLENNEFKSATVGDKTISLDQITKEKGFGNSYSDIAEGRLNKVGKWRERMTVREEFVNRLQANVNTEFAQEAKYIRSGIFDVIAKKVDFSFSGWRQKGRGYLGKTAAEARTQNILESAEKTQSDQIPTNIGEIDNLSKQERSEAKLKAHLEKNGGVFNEELWQKSLAADAENAGKIQGVATKVGTGVLILSLACIANQAFAHTGEIQDSNEQQAELVALDMVAKRDQVKSGEVTAEANGAQADRYDGAENSSYYAWATQQSTIPDDEVRLKLKPDNDSTLINAIRTITSPSTWSGYGATLGQLPGLPSGEELDAKVCGAILSPEGAITGAVAELAVTAAAATLSGGGAAAAEQGGGRILAELFVKELFTSLRGVISAKTAGALVGIGLYSYGLHMVATQMSGNAIATPESGAPYMDAGGLGTSLIQEKETRSMYGRPLSHDEAKQVDQRYLAAAKADWNSKSFATRYFDAENPFSVVGSIAASTPSGLNSTVSSAGSLLTNAGSMLFGNLGKIFMGSGKIAYADDDYNPFGDVNQSGFSAEELDKMRNDPTYSQAQNSNYISDSRIHELDSQIGKCFDPTRTQREMEEDSDCTAEKLSSDEILRYRISKLDDALYKVLTDPVRTGSELGGSAPAAPTTPGNTTITAPTLNGYTVPCGGQRATPPRQPGPKLDWSSAKESGTTGGVNSAGQPIKVYIRAACDTTNVKTIFIGGGIHGTENGGQLVAWDLLFNATLPANVQIVAVPEINGTGIAAGTRRNSRGVDLNRNFSYNFGQASSDASCNESQPSCMFYHGSGADSEPETQALEGFLQSIGRTNLFVIYHDNLNYVAPVGSTDVGIGNTYATLAGMHGQDISTVGSTKTVTQHGSLDAWYNNKTGSPTILVELGSDQSQGVIDKNVNAIISMSALL